MEFKTISHFLFPLPFFIFFLPLSAHNLQTYIVQLHPQLLANSSSTSTSSLQWHLSFLERTNISDPSSRLLYSYHSAINGFAARLSDLELSALQATHGVIAIRPDHRLQTDTTYSYKFLGLDHSSRNPWFQSKPRHGSSIIGVLDTGVWPESPSFGDKQMPPVPKRWRGVCQEGQSFNSSLCNRKLIGARFYMKGHRASSIPPPSPSIMEYISPRDSRGHGTHTSSTAAGNSVPSVSVLGNGAGEARGMAPGAHLAMYKVCWFNECFTSDILAAIEDAIRDGVDVLSLSLGGFPMSLYDDSIAIGAFRATERGIMVVCAAGNNGPIPSSVANVAPWITTVGASSLDRRFPANVHMGDGEILNGESMYPKALFSNGGREIELVYGGINGAEFCYRGSLSKQRVGGKMVVCDRGVSGRALKGEVVKESGGAAMILANTEINLEENSVDVHVLPATLIGYAESIRLKRYINSTRRPTARIEFGGTVIGKSRAPAIALFSSRGPSLTDPSILKPDVVAPGVNIIAAWPENLGPSGLPEDSRRVNFNVLSGTSMACPHVSGIAALIRAAHPSWSPAAIKSSIMTTTDILDHWGKPLMDGRKPAGLFTMGAGHVNPDRAIDPGLVYDINPDDYIAHLCTIGYTKSEIFTIAHRAVNCFDTMLKNRDFSLNYPSLSVIFKSGMRMKMIKRRLTNVGSPNSTYSVQVIAPQGLKVIVRPESLTFSQLYQIKGYRVWFISRKRIVKEVSYGEGDLTWVHNHQSHYRVRSPISVTWV